MTDHESCRVSGCWVARLLESSSDRLCPADYCKVRDTITELFTPGVLESYLKEKSR